MIPLATGGSQPKPEQQEQQKEESDFKVNLKALAALTAAASCIGAYFNIRRYQREQAKEQMVCVPVPCSKILFGGHLS